jgi:glycosyltransferase involved in cell wall biosynthesis
VNSTVIFESSLDGHRVRYVQILVQHLVSRGEKPTVVLPVDARDSPEFRGALAVYADRVFFQFVIPRHPTRGLANMWARWNALYLAVKTYAPNNVLVPTADILVQGAFLFRFVWWRSEIRRVRFTYVVLRLRFGYKLFGIRDLASRIATFIALRCAPSSEIYSIDSGPVRALERFCFFPPAVKYLPDPLLFTGENFDHAHSKILLDLPTDALVIGCVGALDERKGVDLLIDAFLHLDDSARIVLALIGRPSAALKNILKDADTRLSPGKQIILREAYLSEVELARYIAAFDLFAALYFSHLGPSSFVLMCASAGTPVISSHDGWIGRTVVEHDLGWRCEDASPDSILATLVVAVMSLRMPVRTPSTPSWLSDHSVDHFCVALCKG